MSEPEGRAMLMPLLRDDVLAGDVRRAVEQVEDDARAELRASLAAKVAGLRLNPPSGLLDLPGWAAALDASAALIEGSDPAQEGPTDG